MRYIRPKMSKLIFFYNILRFYYSFRGDRPNVVGEPGLVERVLALHAGSRGFDSHRGHMSKRFFRSNRPGYPHPVSWKIVSELRSVIAVSLNVGGGVRRLSNRQNCTCASKHYKHNEDGRTAPGVCGNGSVPLSHSGTSLRELEYTHRPNAYTLYLLFLRKRNYMIKYKV